ncbi:unnamed protein product [Toxocara canis]|uniref:Ectonucleotide pyrophosphatase/phosphodiesterase family member 4 n=1 Tax=Toxocara canis TaxID=6265 RepID=A0A183VFH5_TOXCA|nr:unnamed protein product [Toxocara canis]
MRIESPRNVFCISSHVDLAGIKVGDNMLYISDKARQEQVYEKLKKAVSDGNYKINVYYKKDFPLRFGYKNTPRVGDIILEPHIGYAVHPFCPPELSLISRNQSALHMSTHGMSPDEPEMRALLVMKGPAFNENVKVNSIPNNTDLYALMCHVLGILEAPNNGSISSLLMALRIPRAVPWAMPDPPLKAAFFDKLPTLVITVLMPGLMLLVFCITLCCFAVSEHRGDVSLLKGYRLLNERGRSHQGYVLRRSQNAVNDRTPRHGVLMSMSSEDEL